MSFIANLVSQGQFRKPTKSMLIIGDGYLLVHLMGLHYFVLPGMHSSCLQWRILAWLFLECFQSHKIGPIDIG